MAERDVPAEPPSRGPADAPDAPPATSDGAGPAASASQAPAPADAPPADPAPAASVAVGRPARRRGPRAPRPHPYREEPSPEAERRLDAGRVTLLWSGLATLLAVGGVWLQQQYGYVAAGHALHPDWETWTRVPLFVGLGLLGFGFVRQPWARRVTLVGWLLFAAYWGLAARDLLVTEGDDYFNFVAALVGVYFFVYLAYHEWLSRLRGVDNRAVHFLNVATFVAAGTYFLVDKIVFLRYWIIRVVGVHTRWMLDALGFGDGLSYQVDAADRRSPVTFSYPEHVYSCPDGVVDGCSRAAGGWLDRLLFYSPSGENLTILPVSIILACTAIQSIMLFVGLFVATTAPWRRKLAMSFAVGGVVYALNLLRNTGIIWFYGQGKTSFWLMHNAVGKGGSLLAMVAIAVVSFRYLPQLLQSLFDVLDLKDRDGPIERFLKIGRRRPAAPVAA